MPQPRRGEAVELDREHVDLSSGTVQVRGKGRRQRDALRLPEPTADALRAWLTWRGDGPGALFTSLDPASRGHRLTGHSVYRMIRRLGDRLGLRARPHGLRHAAITEALDLTHGDARAVRRFARHASLDTVLVYDDNRRDLGGQVARLVAGSAEMGGPARSADQSSGVGTEDADITGARQRSAEVLGRVDEATLDDI